VENYETTVSARLTAIGNSLNMLGHSMRNADLVCELIKSKLEGNSEVNNLAVLDALTNAAGINMLTLADFTTICAHNVELSEYIASCVDMTLGEMRKFTRTNPISINLIACAILCNGQLNS